jgi:hypothetical protein
MPPISAELLVRYGLFPENLPSVFTTRAIWPQLPPATVSYAVTNKAVGELCTYDASKRGGQRRIFGIPHPLFIRDQGIFFERHWAEIESCFEAATGSTSHPIIDLDGARHIRVTPHSELPRIRLTRLSRFAFCLVRSAARLFDVFPNKWPSRRCAAKCRTTSMRRPRSYSSSRRHRSERGYC